MPRPSSPKSLHRQLDELAQNVRKQGVAPEVAVGFGRFIDGSWTFATGGDASRVFDLASLTKPLLAVAAARSGLRRQALRDLVPETVGSPVASAPVELALAHRIGLDAHVPLFLREFGAPEEARAIVARSLRPDCRGERPSEGFPPLYSDLGYILAGEALARREGAIDAGEAIARHVVRPLGLEEHLGTARELTAVLGEADFQREVVPTEHVPWRGGLIRGVVHDENAWVLTGRGGSGHAGMFGTVEGVLRFGAHVFAERDAYDWLIRERPMGTLRAGFDGKSETGSSAGARMGRRAFGHLGFTGTSLWIDPDANMIVSLLTNRVNPTRENLLIKSVRPIVHDALFNLALTID